ncbi:hypothetical protein EMN47_16645 [Prolixibacteraceae bacterium JC049]|nr:hypothetical protein [Prolixibacteraceae bacterium JC049]
MKKLIICLLMVSPFIALAQKKGTFSASFESNSQYYFNEIAKNIRDKKIASNNYLDLSYRYGKFEAGGTFESYLPNPLLGYATAFDKSGLTKMYLSYQSNKLNIRLGDVYEQFGGGLIYRTFRERDIGIDQSTFGVGVNYRPFHFLRIKAIAGKPNFYFGKQDATLYGADAEVDFGVKNSNFTLGLSSVLKQEPYSQKAITQHNNVKLYSARLGWSLGNFDVKTEWAYKTPDANVLNNYSRKAGRALQISPSYSKRGFGVNINFRAVDNMQVLNERELDANGDGRKDEDVFNYKLNYLPSIARIHSYNIYNVYTYQSKENNEIGFNASLYYKFKKNTPLGGKYGTKVSWNSSVFYTQFDLSSKPTEFLRWREKMLSEHGFRVEKKLSKRYKLIAEYTYQEYNKFLVEDDVQGKELVYSNVFLVDLLTKIDRKNSIKTELGYMSTKNDLGNWGTVLVEYANSKGWSVFASDQYNFTTEKKHYYLVGGAYAKGKSRIALSYGETRDGYTCVGGICKFLPGAKALSLSVAFKL